MVGRVTETRRTVEDAALYGIRRLSALNKAEYEKSRDVGWIS